MEEYEYGSVFQDLIAPLEAEKAQAARDAFIPQARPVPEHLVANGQLPPGHVALMGSVEFKP